MAEVALFVEQWLALPVYRPGLQALRKLPDQLQRLAIKSAGLAISVALSGSSRRGGMDEF
ncbi:TPA: hypothetical protein L3743_006687 [Pseudomonas aeruginosa]|nr:hypothetical protein [Pseudomonas aeruginosa]HBN8673488.1 hypothetical protein [Pseudomonas aeruginosa]